MLNFGERLTEERKRLGLNQTDFGAVGGVTKTSQVNYESGMRSPDAKYWQAIAGLGADVNYILTGIRMEKPEKIEPKKETLLTGEGTMLKGGGASNDELRLSSEELEFVKMLRGMSEYQKNDTLKTAENFIRSNREIIERYSRGDLRMAA